MLDANRRQFPYPQLRRLGRTALVVGGLALAVGLLGVFTSPAQFMRAYLVAYVFWLGLMLGCLALVLLHHLAGGRWGLPLLRPLEAAVRLLPLAALFFLPIALGLRHVYPWTGAQLMAEQAHLQHKLAYLNIPFFLLRAGFYFLVWIALAYFVTRWSLQLDAGSDPRLARRLRTLSALGLMAFGLTATFAAIDWLMSLEPEWYSTIYGGMVAMGFVLGAFSLGLIVVAWLARRGPYASAAGLLTAQTWNDLGNLLLTFLLLWIYLSYSQFLVIWMGNIREEAPWYILRGQGGWQWLALAVVVLSFLVPGMLLLSRGLKRSGLPLALIAGLVLLTRYADTQWLISPPLASNLAHLSWLDLLLPLALGGLWLAGYAWQLGRHPLLPSYDPRERQAQALEHART